MLLFPNAKLNLGLHITARRPDGYHTLETAFVPLPWCDALEVLPPATASSSHLPTLLTTGRPVPGAPHTNLCRRAYDLLKADFPALPPARLHLHKVVPMGAGLGGGSADAAFTLRGLNEVFGLGLTTDALLPYARRLGADCAFFLLNHPVLATGRGDEFTPLALPQLASAWAVVVWPGLSISTAEAFRGVTPAPPPAPLADVLARPLTTWPNALINDFEAALTPRYPVLGEVKARLYEAGAAYASLSGSGSAVYGLFPQEPPALAWPEAYAVWRGTL